MLVSCKWTRWEADGMGMDIQIQGPWIHKRYMKTRLVLIDIGNTAKRRPGVALWWAGRVSVADVHLS